MAISALDRVYQELAPAIRLLRPSCRSRALVPPADLVAFLQRLAVSRPRDRALVVVEAPEVHCFLALQEFSKGQGTDPLHQIQYQMIESLCENVSTIAACRKALRTVFLHYDSNEVSVAWTVKLLQECASRDWWDIVKLVVGRLCAHLKAAELRNIEQKVLGTLRDALVPFGVNCLGVLLEPLHKLIFLHFSSLMAQGTAPEVDNLPPAVKWYLRLLRKCAGKVNGNLTTASTIKKSDIDFLFWPFITPFSESRANFILPNQTSSKETRDWSSRHDMKIKSWQDMLVEQLRIDLKMPKDEGPCYNWLPFAEYALSPDLWIWLHDLLLHSNGRVEDIESRHKRFLKTSATGARTLGVGTALVEILAREIWTCNNFHVLENVQQALTDSNGKGQDQAAECCGCIHQDAKSAGNAAALLIWLLRPDSMELCDSSWVVIINNLLLATLTTREESAIQYHNPSGNHLSDRVDPGLSHEGKIPLQAIDSTFITLVQTEKDFLLNKWSIIANQLRAQAWKLAERSKWRLEEVVWPALLSQISCCSYSFTYHRVLEILEPFAPRCSEMVDDPFPLLHLQMDQFLGVVKQAPRFILPLMGFLKSGSKITAPSCFKQGESEDYVNQGANFAGLNLCVLQEEEFTAAINHCVLQESELWAQKQDVLVMQIAAFSGGSFRYLVGESEDSVKPIESDVTKKSGKQSNSSIFGELCARKKGDLRRAGLVAAIEGRRLLAWELRKWIETLQSISNALAEEDLPNLEALRRIYIWASALRNEFPTVDTWVAVGLSALGRFLRVQEEDALWELEVPDGEADKGARSDKRPRLNSYTTIVHSSKILETEREGHEWIVEALCRSPASSTVEKYLVIYLGLQDKKRGGPKKSRAKSTSDAVSLHRQYLVSYLAKHPSQIPNFAYLCRNRAVLQVACEALQEAAKSISSTNGPDIFELWLQFLEKFREAGCNVRSITYLHVGTLLARMTECALHHTTLISNWPQNLLESLVSESPAMVRRIYEEARGHIESRLLAHDATLKDLEVDSVDLALSGVVAAMDRNPKAVAQYLESTLFATDSNVQKPSQFLQSSSLLDLLSMGFARCKSESRIAVLSHIQESDLYKKSNEEGFGACVRRAEALEQKKDQPVPLGQAFVFAVVFWRSRILKDLKNSYAKHRATTRQIAGAVELDDQILSHSEQRAAICHVLLTSEPQLSSQTYSQTSSVSGEELIFQLQEFAPLEENPGLCSAIVSWILLYCRMNIRLNLEQIAALCRLHPCTVRDALIEGIEADMVDANRVEGKFGWKNSLEELKNGLLQGLLAWLPLDARSHFTTTVGVPSGFWLGSNIKGVEEVTACLRSTDAGVRRSAYCLVVAHQHHHHFVSSLAQELCNKIISSELTREQEALLRVLMPALMSQPHTASMMFDPVTMLFRKAMDIGLSLGGGNKGKNGTLSSEQKQQHVKALLRVGLIACEVSPDRFATEEIALLLATLAKMEDPSEEIAFGAMQCLVVLALDLRVTIEHVKLMHDLLLHLVYKPAGDHVWHLAMTCAERFAAGIAPEAETNDVVKEEISTTEGSFSMQELLFRCPLQRSIPLQAILKQLSSIDRH